ncbi:hypothetical protein [Flavobacterium terrisoli]|uniref:hypothetical protein n=1 Tax=Flavobacterium terrisoli TaxID=3242195 RepID=UPI0025433058|nr:hypothetical protein [Flavobacterium buctense]
MKKITLIVAFIGMITLQSCTVNDNDGDAIDNDTIGEVFEYTNVNFLPNDYSVVLEYPHAIFNSDMVLVYRLSGSFQGEDIWKPLPETYFFGDGTLDLRYDFDFTRFDAQVYMEGFDLAGVSSSYRLNQVFRVVVIPAYFGKDAKVNFNDYNAVVKAFNIDESKIIKVQ